MSWEKSGVTSTFHDDKKVLTATFNTPDGANLAVQALQEAEKQGLLDVENTVTVSKNAKGKLEIPQATSEGGRKGARIGALAGGVVGLIFPPSILATSALGAAVGGMTGSLRGPHIDGFDAAEIKTMADELQRGSPCWSPSSIRTGRTTCMLSSRAWPRGSAGRKCRPRPPRQSPNNTTATTSRPCRGGAQGWSDRPQPRLSEHRSVRE